MAKINVTGLNPSEGGARSQLPADQAFVCRIVKTKIEENSYGSRLVFMLEIIEGEYKDFFKTDFDAQKGGKYEAKYKGIFRVNIPGQNSQHYDWDLAAFNRALGAVEASNPGYKFADTMDTDTLKGKTVGILTREAEYNDNVYTEIGMLLSVDRARSGNFKPMKRRGGTTQTASTAPATASSAFSEVEDDDDLPF